MAHQADNSTCLPLKTIDRDKINTYGLEYYFTKRS